MSDQQYTYDEWGQWYGPLPVDQLQAPDRNARRGDMDVLEQSMRELGFYGAVLVRAEDHVVVAGNHRLEQARREGMDRVPCIVMDRDTLEARKIALVDNRSNDRASYDTGVLLAELDALDGDLSGTGWAEDDLADLLATLDADDPSGYGGVGDDLSGGGGGGGGGDSSPGNGALVAKFGAPPYSILDTRQGYWQARKGQWLALGIQSEVGRDQVLKGLAHAGAITANTLESLRAGSAGGGTASIFDATLCELVYRWYLPPGDGHTILDPFAGGSVRGVVAGWLGHTYHGLELRDEQVSANVAQAAAMWQPGYVEGLDGEQRALARLLGECTGPRPQWWAGDSAQLLDEPDLSVPDEVDLVFTCPPYGDLEVYSEDPADLSAMDHAAFRDALAAIMAAACARLREDRFCVVVMGEARDRTGAYYGLVPDTIAACTQAGLAYHGEAVLITPGGTLPVRAGRAFNAGRKLGKSHQNVLVFYNGDPRNVGKVFGPVAGLEDLEDPEDDGDSTGAE